MKKCVVLVVVLAIFSAATGFAGEVFVLPVIADSVPGMYDSLWETQVRIIKTDLTSSVTIKRLWVCLPEGGFVDDPETAPSWELPFSWEHVTGSDSLVLNASDLLAGTGADIGAVAIEIEGGGALVDCSVVDVNLGGMNEGDPLLPYGMGQSYSAFQVPLQGDSHVPWIGGCYGSADLSRDCKAYFRNNIGIVNPNPEPLEVQLWPIPYFKKQLSADRLEEIPTRTIPVYGWQQIAVPLNEQHAITDTIFGLYSYPQYAVLNIIPGQEMPYFAYASVVYTPLPDVSETQFSDPYFQQALPGYVMNYRDLGEPPE